MMLLECHYIDEEGGIAEIEPKSVKLTQKTCPIIVSHDNRCIYLFKGNEVSIVQKFQSARTGSQMRLQQGYKIKHIEDFAWQNKCDLLELVARPGWKKVLKPFGYKESHILLEKKKEK